MIRYRDRAHAGRRLAEALRSVDLDDPLVLALPRGGVVVAAPVAAALGAELDVLVVRKIGAPRQPELGVGAIAEGGQPLLDDRLLARLGIGPADLAPVVTAERAELQRRVDRYRGGDALPDVAGRTVVLVDDGLATGSTAHAALQELRRRGAGRVVLAVPVAAPDTLRRLEGEADLVVCLEAPRQFGSVGQAYEDFRQTSDADVLQLLGRSD